MDEPIITINHVSMMFNIASEQLNSLKEYFIALMKRELHFKEFMALEDIDFVVERGEQYGIVGTNGSGKSTLLKIIAGVLEPSKGSVSIEGSIAPLIELGAGFDMDRTARENIYLNGALLGYSRQFMHERFDEIVDFAEVRDFLDMPMKNYSSAWLHALHSRLRQPSHLTFSSSTRRCRSATSFSKKNASDGSANWSIRMALRCCSYRTASTRSNASVRKRSGLRKAICA